MKDNPKVEMKVGVFLILSFVLMVISLFAIDGDQALFSEYNTYKVRFTQVTGLGKGSVVQVLGVHVGNVTKIDFADDSNDLIASVAVLKKYAKKFTKGSLATVKTKGALGDKYIYIEPAKSDELIGNNGFIQAHESGDIFSIISDNADGVNNAFEILKEIRILLHDVNGDRQIAHIIKNLQSTSKDLQGSARSVNKALATNDLAKSLNSLSSVLAKIDNGEGSLGALINDPSLHLGIKRMLGSSKNSPALKSVVRDSIIKSESK